MKATQDELARRIENAKPADAEGRYDMASKVEVKAYFAKQFAQLKYDQDRIPILEARIAELELSFWARFKRWFNAISRRIDQKLDGKQEFTIKQEPVLLTGDQLAEVLRNIERKNAATARVIAAPPEFAAKYGEQGGVEVKEGESLSVKLPLAR